MRRFLQHLARRRPVMSEAGVTAIEYGLIAALIAVAIIAGVQALGTHMDTMFRAVSTTL